MIKLCLIVPCYNEEEILDTTYARLSKLLQELIAKGVLYESSKICFVDDGSRDSTWQILEKISYSDDKISVIKLSRNFGHQFALLAGLDSMVNLFDIYITIDADLQDDISTLEEMIHQYNEGNEVVYGVRKNRSSDTVVKRKTAEFFYHLMKGLGVNTIYNHSDYRLISNKVLIEFLRFREVNLFLRGIFPLVGFKNSCVYYERKVREAGKTKYPLGKMIAFAWEGISSFSIRPMRMILYLGILTFLFSLIISVWAIIVLISGKTVPGWFSTIFLSTIIGGIQMISLGIIGEYIGKIYNEIKSRPRYIIEKMKK
jgi:glycosyltransferase involved in cell wall biosynthesis